MEYIHSQELLHLHLTPFQVLIGRRFHELFLTGGEWTLPTLPAIVSGFRPSADYIAPEQVAPDRLGAPTVVTDVYGLGGVLYKVLYGNPPNRGRSSDRELVGWSEMIRALLADNGPSRPGAVAR